MVPSFLRELRLAARKLARSPGFVTVAVVTLALGIGATSAVFSLMRAIDAAAVSRSQSTRSYLTRKG